MLLDVVREALGEVRPGTPGSNNNHFVDITESGSQLRIETRLMFLREWGAHKLRWPRSKKLCASRRCAEHVFFRSAVDPLPHVAVFRKITAMQRHSRL